MKKFTLGLASATLGLAVFFSLLFASSASAVTIMDGVNAAQGTDVPDALFGDTGIITTITNVLLFIAGGLAVIMIIIGGLRYVTSAGNASSVTAAKNTILYAIVGLIVAFLAYAAVNFVLSSVTTSVSGGQFPTSNL